MRQLGAALLVLVLAGCSLGPQKEDPVQTKLSELDGRVARIERVVANQSLLDMAQKLDAAQADVRSLRGRVEELENSNEALRKQQRDLYSDLDKRLAGYGASATGASGVGGAYGGGAPGASGTPGGGAGATGGAAAEQAAYTQAFDALKNSNYPAAIAGFRNFLTVYPASSIADNAQYWLGEAYYVTRDYDQAANAFRTVGERWPNSRKSADALLKLGFTQYEQKRYAEARVTLADVTRRFPDTDAARLATERLGRIPAGAR
jgi:tol-pal system protein YbgF